MGRARQGAPHRLLREPYFVGEVSCSQLREERRKKELSLIVFQPMQYYVYLGSI
jgi:hypothetical protein